jgi:hypothetical protein
MPSTVGILASSVFTPLSLPDLSAWFDAADLSTIAQTSGSVSSWTSKSEEAWSATQATNANQPTTGANTLNGLNVIDFDGNDFLDSVSRQIVSATNGTYTAFAVVKQNNTTDIKLIIAQDPGGGIFTRMPQFLRFNATSAETIAFLTTDAAIADSTTGAGLTFHQVAGMARTNNLEVWIDGVSNGPTSFVGSLKTSSELFSIGARPNLQSPSNRLNGAIAEIVIYGRAITNDEKQQIETYFSSKWGI